MARAHELGEHGFHAFEIGEFVLNVAELVLREAARLVAMRPILQFQQVRYFVEAEAQPLGRLDEPNLVTSPSP